MAFWIPRSVEELESAVESDSVIESHFLDCKEFTESGRVPKTVAKCVASLAVDGGVVVLGVGEEKQAQRLVLKPVLLTGLRDAVDAMISNSVTPSLRVSVDVLDRGDGTGYLVVIVPESARAPHMVDGRYYGRSDSAAQPLSDGEVRRLWLRQLDRRADRDALLVAEVDREPVPARLRSGARLFVIAQPMSADSRLLLNACEGRDLRRWAWQANHLPVFERERDYRPHIGLTQVLHRRARGVARSSDHLQSDRTVRVGDLRSPAKTVDVEIWEDGGLRLYYGPASDTLRNVDYLLVSRIAGEVSGMIELAREVAKQTGFRGSWSLGVALRGLKSLPAHSDAISGEPEWKYSEDCYDETTESDHATLFSAGSPILEELLGRFLRSTFAYNTGIETLDIFSRADVGN